MTKDWKANWDRWYGNPENRAKKLAYSLKRYNEKKEFLLEQKKKRIKNNKRRNKRGDKRFSHNMKISPLFYWLRFCST